VHTGNFEIYGLPNGKYKMCIVADGYQTAIREDIFVLAGFPVDLELLMTSKGSINNANLFWGMYAQKVRSFFLGTAYALTNYDCPTLLRDYEVYLSRHLDDAYETFAFSLVCVVDHICDDLRNGKFSDCQGMLNIMNCVHEPWSVKETPCWKWADGICNVQKSNFIGKLNCYMGELYCHWAQDLWDCGLEYRLSNAGEYLRVVKNVGVCIPLFVYTLFF
jgi:hypothetical protein